MTLLKPWLMGIEYIIVIYTLILIVNSVFLSGITQSLKIVVVLFIVMSIYIIFVNFARIFFGCTTETSIEYHTAAH